MYLLNRSTLCCAGLLVAFSSIVNAEIFEFQVAKLRIYSQTSSSPPITPDGFLMDTYVDMEIGDATLVTMNALSLVEEFPGQWEGDVEFGSQSALDAAFPGFVFNLHIEGGALGTRDENVTLSSPAMYPVVAALTPESYTNIQGADPSADLLIEWNTPDANTNVVFLYIYDVENDTDIFDGELLVSQTSYLIDASSLAPGQEYEIELAFANAELINGQPAPGFGTSSEGITGYASITLLSFTTAPEGCDDVGRFVAVKGADYTQDADNTEPVAPDAYFFGCFIDSTPGGIGTASLEGDLSPLVAMADPDGLGFWEDDSDGLDFENKANLDSAFPSSSTYEFHINGGAFGARDQNIAIGADDYPDVPYLVGTGYSDLQGMDPAQELSLDWALAGAGTSVVFVDIYGGSETDKLFLEFDSSVTSMTIPADLLVDGVEYELLISFVNGPVIAGDACPGFGIGSEGFGGFVSSTAIFFMPQSPVMCPADLTGDGAVNFFDVSAFLQAFSAQDPIADFTNDGSFNFFDVSAFLGAFAMGCP